MGKTNREMYKGKWVSRKTLTAGEARAILAAAKERKLSGMGKVNRGLTRQQTWDIMSAGIKDIADDAPVHSIVARNIRREFG